MKTIAKATPSIVCSALSFLGLFFSIHKSFLHTRLDRDHHTPLLWPAIFLPGSIPALPSYEEVEGT